MSENNNQPKADNTNLENNDRASKENVLLEGLESIQGRLKNGDIDEQIEALGDALQYRDRGLTLIIDVLKNGEKWLQDYAYQILVDRTNSQIEKFIQEQQILNLSERIALSSIISDRHRIFANRKIREFEPNIGIRDPGTNTYALRTQRRSHQNIINQIKTLLEDPQANKIEALVLGMWISSSFVDRSSKILVNALVEARHQLSSLKALFIGDIEDEEMMISSIQQSNISPVLEAYPNLEILQIRGSEELKFSPIKHDNLKALIIESSGLNRQTIAELCQLQLP